MINKSFKKTYTYTGRQYRADAIEAAFLLGGIGTGNFSIGARGELRDWELFNRPGKGNILPFTFFALHIDSNNTESINKVLEANINPPFNKARGYSSSDLAGLPRFEDSSMSSQYPFVEVELFDKDIPVSIKMEAFTPFIPLNADDSGIPGAIIRYHVCNESVHELNVSIAGSVSNVTGVCPGNTWPQLGPEHQYIIDRKLINDFRDEQGIHGLYFTADRHDSDDLRYGSMALMTTDDSITVKKAWLDQGWSDGIHEFWDDFTANGRLTDEPKYEAENVDQYMNPIKTGSLAIIHTLKPGEARTFEFMLTWYFPNRVKEWNEDSCCGTKENDYAKCSSIKNYYATKYNNAWHVGQYLMINMKTLESLSRSFQNALYSTTIPDYVIEAIANNITVIRSTTCFRLEDGTLMGWEGCNEQSGCCEGSCTHVWNYAQTLAFLFPELEKTMRRVEFNIETDENGKMAFRNRQIFGLKKHDFYPAADGQLGTIIRLYRDWKFTGDDFFLYDVWENASKALDFAFVCWDKDQDNVLDSQQHNTYDIEFYGPNSLVNTIFYAALKAGIVMARYVGDKEHEEKYRQAFETGSKRMDEMLWGGDYYIQSLENVNQFRYQYGKGCLSDQLLGQLLAHVVDLGYILPEKRVKKAVHSIYKYNFQRSLKNHSNVQRTYALNDEAGLLLCTWPKGGRPKLPFIYSDEVWTGIEYQVAAHLIYEGFVQEGLKIVKAVRDRHDGYRRNPWNEVECGNHYARSLSSWALLTALSGFKFDLVEKKISFNPNINKASFSTFWSTGNAWGIYKQNINPDTNILAFECEVLYGDLYDVKIDVSSNNN